MHKKTLGQLAYEAGVAADRDMAKYSRPLEWNLLDENFRDRYEAEAAAVAKRCIELIETHHYSRDTEYADACRKIAEAIRGLIHPSCYKTSAVMQNHRQFITSLEVPTVVPIAWMLWARHVRDKGDVHFSYGAEKPEIDEGWISIPLYSAKDLEAHALRKCLDAIIDECAEWYAKEFPMGGGDLAQVIAKHGFCSKERWIEAVRKHDEDLADRLREQFTESSGRVVSDCHELEENSSKNSGIPDSGGAI